MTNDDGDSASQEGLSIWAARLAPVLAAAVERSVPDTGAAMAFSGGVDSGLVAMLAARKARPLTLYCVGLPGAPDLPAARRAAEALGLSGRLAVVEAGPEEVLEAAKKIWRLLPDATLLEVSFLVPALLVSGRAAERDVLTGDGADELFGGYHRYASMWPGELPAALERDVDELLSCGLARHRAVAGSAGKRLRTPYLDPEVVSLARSIPPGLKVLRGERKAVLRRAAALLGLPRSLCSAQKRAAQYGTGVHALLMKKKSR
ncbi:MAG: hypothetical protein FJ149_08265 [Euryarchaeota archaeon]|nr:hypothetical protein [Euryarchaeota archaeon]